MDEKTFRRDMQNQAQMKEGLFETYKQFKTNSVKGRQGHINLDLINAEIKMCETYTKQILAGVHMGQLLEKQKTLQIEK